MQRVLIVDDLPEIRSALRRTLNKLSSDWIIEEAGHGAEALDIYFAGNFDIVLLDVQMPGPDGWEVLQTIRADDEDVTIIMVTANLTPDNVLRAAELGASGFVPKPFGISELAEALGLDPSKRLLSN